MQDRQGLLDVGERAAIDASPISFGVRPYMIQKSPKTFPLYFCFIAFLTTFDSLVVVAGLYR